MITITNDFKNKVVAALATQRSNFEGGDDAYARQFGINPSVYNQIKNGKKLDGLLATTKWLELGRLLDVSMDERKWNVVRTDVYKMIEEDVDFCQEFAKAKICVDETSIGKSFTAKQLARTRKNCFYVDASQAKTKQLFIRLIAKTVGVDTNGRYIDIKANLKYYLKLLNSPIIIIDEAGDLEYPAFLELKELWNATEGVCGWYMIGADGLRDKISRGIKAKKVGYREIFARYGEKYTTPTPVDKESKYAFYRKLITDVVNANLSNKQYVQEIVKKCLIPDENGIISGLRRAENLIIIYSKKRAS